MILFAGFVVGVFVFVKNHTQYKCGGEDLVALNMAIQALEQDPINDVLDKIRAEIEQNAYPIVHGVNNHEKGMTLYGILQIIDKYRKEQTEE